MDGRTYMPTTHIRRHRTIIRFAPETIRNEAITNDFSKSFVPRTRRSGTHDSPHTLWTRAEEEEELRVRKESNVPVSGGYGGK